MFTGQALIMLTPGVKGRVKSTQIGDGVGRRLLSEQSVGGHMKSSLYVVEKTHKFFSFRWQLT